MEHPSDKEMVVRPRDTAAVSVSAQREVAEVQGAMILARKFPRNPIDSMEHISNMCQLPGLAEVSMYSYSRGGTDITGPSIRLAEVLAQGWKNIHYGIQELEQRNGESTMQAWAWDLESNVRVTRTFQVKHQRYTKKGSYALEDPRDIYEHTANMGSRRVRACILELIPGNVTEAAVKECEATLTAKADTSPEALKKMLAAFAEHGVTKEQVEKRIQRKLEAITPAQKVNMGKIYNSLKDGMSTAADWFEIEAPADEGEAKGTEALKDKLKGGEKEI